MPSDRVKLTAGLRQARRSATSLSGVIKQPPGMFTFPHIPHPKTAIVTLGMNENFLLAGLPDTSTDTTVMEDGFVSFCLCMFAPLFPNCLYN